MADSCEVVAKDKISDLPSPIVDRILDFMPTRDAARTSILSRKWRYVWACHPTIRLDPSFLRKGRIVSENEFLNITTTIFLQHLGPVHNFSLKFPSISSANNNFYPYVDHLLLFLSRKGIREISLENNNEIAYSLPSYVFSATQLEKLSLRCCIFKSPNDFQIFHRLAYLKLVRISFLLTKGVPVLSTPHLECLKLIRCSGVCHFKISAPELNSLYIYRNDDVDLSGFLISKHLHTVSITLAVEKPLLNGVDFTRILESWPLISRLSVDVPTLMCLAADKLQKLPITCSSLKHLKVRHMNFVEIHQIALILCLLRSSPLLSRLDISVNFLVKDVTESVSNYLSEPQCSVGIMNELLTVTIEHFNGTKAEMLFIKILLSCSPRLKTISVQEPPSSSLSENFSISKQLMRLPRASKEAVIVFEPDVKIPKLPNVF